jgi:arsenate reductase (thioredoxin)
MRETLTPKRVLFICLGNACRSPMAEAIARRSAADVIEASSAGLTPLGFVAAMTRETLETNGLSPDGLFSKPVTPELWEAAELVINMSGRPRETAFPDWEKVDDWDVEDPYGADPAVYQRIFEAIEARVAELAERMRREAGIGEGRDAG